MRKMTKAYQLKAMTEQVRAFQYKKKGEEPKWLPLSESDFHGVANGEQVFIRGNGWKKLGTRMRATIVEVPRLPEEWTAANIKEVADKFSLEVAEGLLQGWGSQSLFHDNSVGLSYAKHELFNMAYFGKAYDDFTDKVNELGQRFIKCLLRKRGYHFEGAWMYYGEEIVGQVGLYESVWLSPLQHIEHLIKGVLHVQPMFDPIKFDEMLMKLIAVRRNSRALLDKHVSVKDRIKFLSTQKLANDFEQIFTWQQVFKFKEKVA